MDHHHDHSHDNVHTHDHSDHLDYSDHSDHTHVILGWLKHLFLPHSHSHHTAALDAALATERGIWAVKVSLAVLMATALFQVVIVIISGSVALLADTIHNFGDALTAVPLGLAFMLSRRARNHRYTYGYGRAEDVAGVLIVLIIFFSAAAAIYQSVLKIIHPQPIGHLGWVTAAAVIGFIGNEFVAIFRIRIGREIGSAALVADGLHARTDGLTSLAVLAGVVGVWLGWPLADPMVGIGIGITILGIVWNASRDMWYRIMDAVDPAITAIVERKAAAIQGVLEIHDAAIRWVGHRLRAELHIVVDCEIPTRESHHIAEEVRHALFHTLPALVDVTVHVDPCKCDDGTDYHPTAHHQGVAMVAR